MSRREGVYNRAGEPSVPFWDRGAAALFVVAVVFTRLHDYSACCDETVSKLCFAIILQTVCFSLRELFGCVGRNVCALDLMG